MFSSLPKTNFNSLVTFILSSVNAFNLDHCKILLFGKELTTLKQRAFENIVGKGESAGNHFLQSVADIRPEETTHLLCSHDRFKDRLCERIEKILPLQ